MSSPTVENPDGPLDVTTSVNRLKHSQKEARRKTYNTWIIRGNLTTAAGLNLHVDFEQEELTVRMEEMTWKENGMVSSIDLDDSIYEWC